MSVVQFPEYRTKEYIQAERSIENSLYKLLDIVRKSKSFEEVKVFSKKVGYDIAEREMIICDENGIEVRIRLEIIMD